MTLDQFPSDQNRIIQALEKRIAALESQAGQVKGTPILRASGPFIIPNSSPPDPASGEIGIYSDNGEARWVDDGGGDHSMGVEPGDPVDIVPNMDSGTIGGAPTMAQYNNLYGDARAIRDTVNELIGSLRGNGTIG